MPIDFNFTEAVYDVVRLIPKGKVTSYGAIGTYLGAARSARMVGWTMNKAHSQVPAIPAHRVVNRQGLLTGKTHFKTPSKMQELLEAEGIIVKNDQIVNFKEHFWDPSKHLDL
ncbi:MAG: cysteine methyltransferase [Bacteroidetes bacterium]|nr:MAG: cysteine methyltransferase [Bacteroidota bacterium]